jgi:hypothetical protein
MALIVSSCLLLLLVVILSIVIKVSKRRRPRDLECYELYDRQQLGDQYQLEYGCCFVNYVGLVPFLVAEDIHGLTVECSDVVGPEDDK